MDLDNGDQNRPSANQLQPIDPHQQGGLKTTTTNYQGVDPNDLETLLSMETQQRVDAQTERNKTGPPPRPSRLKFELPVTPSRSRSPNSQSMVYPRARPYRSLSEEGSISMNVRKQSDDDSSSEQAEKARAKRHLEIGTYVTLIKRPLPTMGHVRYIGPVGDEPGDWIGVELEHRVGNCDGAIKGHRYFTTDPQRGIFLKRFDVEAVI
ncbi:CAP Gly-rich domain-containing protein [Chlamydoabsidia padenii]|nr:CAP Gly-rich domain-containing protein [Chlamydoabsidia padenii]